MDRRPGLAVTLIAIAVYVFLLGPLAIVVATSFSESEFLAFPPEGFSGRWYANVFDVSAFVETFRISLQLAVGGTFLSLLIGIPAAYALSRFALPVPRLLKSFFVLPILVPEVVFGFAALTTLNLAFDVPVFPTLLVAHMVVVLPYSVRVVSASLANFDFAAEEAAISLGAGRAEAFFRIVLPNVRSGVIAAFILAFITSMNNVPVSLFLTGPGVSTLPIQMLTYVEYYFDPTIAALSVLLMILTVGVMVVVEKTLGLSYFAK